MNATVQDGEIFVCKAPSLQPNQPSERGVAACVFLAHGEGVNCRPRTTLNMLEMILSSASILVLAYSQVLLSSTAKPSNTCNYGIAAYRKVGKAALRG